MANRRRYSDHIDPEYQRWGRKYPHFPGVAECARLIRAHKNRGTWADIICEELAENAAECLNDLITEFRSDENAHTDVRLFIMMALEIARPPEAVPFLVEVLRDPDTRLARYAESALKGVDTRESRTALWNAAHSGE
jgi:hypothetical protein